MTALNDRAARDRPSRLSKIEPALNKHEISLDKSKKEIISSNLAKRTLRDDEFNTNV